MSHASRLAGALAAVAFALPSYAVPFHGCTFWSGRLKTASAACAQFRVHYLSCTIVHCWPLGCVSYDGDYATGYMPDHFIEVTNRAGASAFTSADAPVMAAQMEVAAQQWKENGDPMSVRTAQDRPDTGNEHSMWFGRTLPVPYGPAGWSLLTTQWTAGTAIPTWFTAITEDAAETWSDSTSSGDRVLAALWAPIAAPACAYGAPLAALGQELPLAGEALPSLQSFAFPLTAGMQKALALSGQTAWDPLKQCMGALGGTLPRTGWTEGDPWIAAQRVAWRTASLSADYWKTGVGVEPGDRWQVIWPPIPVPFCFAPGGLIRPTGFDPTSLMIRAPGYDAAGKKHQTEALFAVWRERTACVEPGEGFAIDAEMTTYPALRGTACELMNQAEDFLGGGGGGDQGGGGPDFNDQGGDHGD